MAGIQKYASALANNRFALVVSLGEVKDLKTGSYKFNVVGKNGEIIYKAASFTIKIANQAPEKTVKLSKSGNIDVLNRDTTSIVYSPKLTNITGTVTNVALTGRGEVVKDKTYSLKFNVYCDGYADNEKPIIVTYKVKVN